MSKGTTLRNVRISDDLWDKAKRKAKADGTNLSEVIREALQAYIDSEESE